MDNNLKKKNKFVNNFDNEYNKQPYFYVPVNDNRQDQIKSNYNNKSKISLELNQNFDPYNYDVNYSNKINTNNQQFTYYSPYNQGPGRGFGNLNVNNDIRFASQSRQHTDEFKVNRESETIDRFEYIDSRYSNPNNLVLPFSRGGETTRKLTENLTSEKNILDYNFSKPNQIKIANFDDSTVSNNFNYNSNDNNLQNQMSLEAPNQQIINQAKQPGIKQRERQINYKENLDAIQQKIDTGDTNDLQFNYKDNSLSKQFAFTNDMTNFYSNNYLNVMKNFNN